MAGTAKEHVRFRLHVQVRCGPLRTQSGSWEEKENKAGREELERPLGSSLLCPGEAENESGGTAKDLSKSKSLKWAYRPGRLKQNYTTPKAAPH